MPKLVSFFDNSTSESIILLLNDEPGLRAKQLFTKLRKKGNSTTFQNIHKILACLVSKKVLEKNRQCYWVSMLWIASIKGFANKLNP